MTFKTLLKNIPEHDPPNTNKGIMGNISPILPSINLLPVVAATIEFGHIQSAELRE